MSAVASDRWSCPSCFRTVVISGSQEDVLAAITAVQTRHATEHRKAAEVVARLGLNGRRRRAS